MGASGAFNLTETKSFKFKAINIEEDIHLIVLDLRVHLLQFKLEK